MLKERTSSQSTAARINGVDVLLSRLVAISGTLGRLILHPERSMALVMALSLMFPLAVLAPPLDMNGMSRAANQLSRKVMRGQDLPVELSRKLQIRWTFA